MKVEWVFRCLVEHVCGFNKLGPERVKEDIWLLKVPVVSFG